MKTNVYVLGRGEVLCNFQGLQLLLKNVLAEFFPLCIAFQKLWRIFCPFFVW